MRDFLSILQLWLLTFYTPPQERRQESVPPGRESLVLISSRECDDDVHKGVSIEYRWPDICIPSFTTPVFTCMHPLYLSFIVGVFLPCI